MILEPWKSADEIDRRLAALNDPELAELIRAANRNLFNEPADAPAPPFWKTRIGLLTLAGLCALAAGYSTTAHTPRPLAGTAPRHAARVVPAAKPNHQAVAVPHRAVAPVRHATPVLAPAVAPSEHVIRKLRAQMVHERAVAEQAQAEAAYARHQAHAQALAQAQAQAQVQAKAEALAQAKAEALAQARAEEVARQQAQALTRAQSEAVQNTQATSTETSIKPGDIPPPSSPHMSVYPIPNGVPPVPGPVIDPNCTPNRGTIFMRAVDHVRVGGTNVGGLLRLIH